MRQQVIGTVTFDIELEGHVLFPNVTVLVQAEADFSPSGRGEPDHGAFTMDDATIEVCGRFKAENDEDITKLLAEKLPLLHTIATEQALALAKLGKVKWEV